MSAQLLITVHEYFNVRQTHTHTELVRFPCLGEACVSTSWGHVKVIVYDITVAMTHEGPEVL